jgi:hypothetical protein
METSSQNKQPDARQRWTSDHQQQAEELHAQGLSYRAIGRELGFSHTTISCRLDPAVHKKKLEQKRRHHAANREERKKKSREWYWANVEKARQIARDYYWANWDECRKKSDQWRRNNLERHRENCRRWVARNPEKARETMRRASQRWREQNPEKAKEKQIRYREANRAKVRERTRKRQSMRRAARRRAILAFNAEQIEMQKKLFGHKCAYCGSSDRLSIDHVMALAAGGLDEISNILPACLTCNCSKQSWPVEEWYRKQPFFTESRWRKIRRHCPAATIGQLPLAFNSTSAA